jgi:hypothetical protein
MTPPQPSPGLKDAPAPAGPERRRWPRLPILQRCLAFPPGGRSSLAWPAIAYNISATGVGLTLPCPLRLGTPVEVEAWGLAGAPRLQARIVHVRRCDFLWFCGCKFLAPLTEAGLQAWLSGTPNRVPPGPAGPSSAPAAGRGGPLSVGG